MEIDPFESRAFIASAEVLAAFKMALEELPGEIIAHMVPPRGAPPAPADRSGALFVFAMRIARGHPLTVPRGVTESAEALATAILPVIPTPPADD